MKRTQVFAGAFCLICLLGFGVYALQDANSDVSDPFVARVGEARISADRFAREYRRHLLTTGQKDSPRLRRHFVDGLINKTLLVYRAREEGVAGSPEFEFASERIRRKLLIEAYTASVIYDEVSVGEGDLLDMFARMNTQLKARHLYARTYEAAQRLHERLQHGETFEDLARETFNDSTLANSGGSVGYFSFDEMDPAFEDAAYSLKPGEISPPVRTAQGYSVIQLEDRFTHPILTETEFAKRRDRVQQYAAYRKRIDARRNHVQEILGELGVTILGTTADRLWQRIRDDRLPRASDEAELFQDTLAVFTVAGRPVHWSVADFRDAAFFSSEERLAAVASPEALNQFVEGLIVQQEMIRRAEELSLDRDPRFIETTGEAVDDWIYEAYRKRFAGSVLISEDSVLHYYERFSGEFVVPEKRQVSEILVENRLQAEEMLRRAGFEPFERLAAVYSMRPGAGLSGGLLGYASRDQLGALADRVFSADENEVIGPFEIAGRYAVLKVGERLEARPAELDEVRGEIEDRLRVAEEYRQLRDAVLEVRDKITVQVVDSVLYSLPLTSQALLDPS